MAKLTKRTLFFIFITIITSLLFPSCFQFDAPIEADFDVQECKLLRDLNEGEDPWYHCEIEATEDDDITIPRKEGELCCLGSECETSLCICGQCMTPEALL